MEEAERSGVVMISPSSLFITWLKPHIESERWEYFNHPSKQEWYRSHAVSWEQITEHFDSGVLTPYPRSASLGEIPIALSYHRSIDYQFFLARAKRGYRKSYSRMEDALQSSCSLTLLAPIIISSGGEGLLFSGYRRLCIGWNYGMVPYVWLVNL